MSNVKERIFGAVTIMSDEDAEKVWNLIQATFLLNNVEEVTPIQMKSLLLMHIILVTLIISLQCLRKKF